MLGTRCTAANEYFLEENKTWGGLELALGGPCTKARLHSHMGWAVLHVSGQDCQLMEHVNVLCGPRCSRWEYYMPERCAREQRGFVLNTVLFC